MPTFNSNIDVGWTGSTMTFVALRAGVSLGTGAATLTTVAGTLTAAGTIDLSAAGLGVVDLVLRDAGGNVAWTNTVLIDSSGNIEIQDIKTEVRQAINGKWADELGNYFNLTVTDIP